MTATGAIGTTATRAIGTTATGATGRTATTAVNICPLETKIVLDINFFLYFHIIILLYGTQVSWAKYSK